MLTVGGSYVEDVAIAHAKSAAHVHFVRSTIAHGIIRSIDVTGARSAPGVLGVFTGDDVDLPPFPPGQPILKPGSERPLIARGRVRFVGEAVVAVVAETKAQAVDAAELVVVDIDPLPPVMDLDHALSGDVVLHERLGTNVYAQFTSERQASFEDCEVVCEFRIEPQRINAAPMEPRSDYAYWEGARLHHYSAVQGAQPTKDMLVRLYGLDASNVRTVVPDMGGGFGVKSRTIGEQLTLGWLARAVGRPVRFVESRSEAMASMPQGRGQRMDVKIGGTRDGRVTAYQLHVTQDAGAYPLMGSYLPQMTMRMTPGVYDIPNCGFTGESVATNRISVTAYRGAGRPEAALAIERAMDRFAHEIGMDPAEVRRKNFAATFTAPWTTGIGTTYDVGDYAEALERVLRAAGYTDLREAQARERAATPTATTMTGIGMSTYVEITSAAAPSEHGSLHLQSDGRIRVLTGATPYGQGHVTTWKMIVADATGLAMDRIDVVHGDTDELPTSGLTVGSRSVQVAGSALKVASDYLIAKAKQRAADLLEANVADVVLDPDAGRFHVVGSATPAVDWAELGASPGEALAANSDFVAPQPTFPFGAHLAVVEVDLETGKVTLNRLVAVDDAGTLINPLIVDGQIHGGIAQGAAQALLEEMHYDADGNPITSNFADYPVISSAELPSFELVHMETPTWVNPLGAKGAGESGTIGSIPAVLNAVVDALTPLGINHLDGPTTPTRVWSALQHAKARR